MNATHRVGKNVVAQNDEGNPDSNRPKNTNDPSLDSTPLQKSADNQQPAIDHKEAVRQAMLRSG